MPPGRTSDARTLDQAHADALADLVQGNATVTTTLTFAIPAVAPAPAAHRASS
ncbi:hypothetical protein SAMN05216199_4047 [Pedococcus cremeus]|uniref:Uncharacterized protein n=1 Tax=Pedococcus cremeus TaxID=587636 RepID=A0A1H9XM80_9MICO|nr:hypothetical protein [Pedococcus cremeus]SES47286.1 hypothetical protein SAMN05216199_4047 [Pedococcus cremeus]